MGPRGVTAIYFTQRANAVAHAPTPRTAPPCQNYDSTRSLCGWLWAQGYNLNCKKIKQFLISSIATALLLVLTFIFISVTSQARILSLSFFFFYTLHSLGVMTSHFMHFALLNLLRNTSCFHLARHKLHGVKYYCRNVFRSQAIYYSK